MTTKKQLVRLSDVPAILLELTGVTRTRGCVYKWAQDGRTSYDNVPIRLKTIHKMGQIFTTREWVEAFITKVG